MKRNDRKSGEVIYISHGGGPMPVLGDKSHEKMIRFLESLPQRLKKPEEILVISAHWEEAIPTIYSAENQTLLYDYYGFPPEAYDIHYPTRENSNLVTCVRKSLGENGFGSHLDNRRGLDHGVYIPLKLMYPEGGIPVTQLSLLNNLDPSSHLELGKALRPLLERNILIIGSGFSFHNMRLFTMSEPAQDDVRNDEFQNWLIEVCSKIDNPDQRFRELESWSEAPQARYCHPREEHLLPLHVCASITGSKADVIFDDSVAGKRAVAFHW